MQKKSIGFGFRGWIVLIYQFLAFVMHVSLNNFGQNVMANVNANVRGWNATLVPTVYTIVCVVSVIIQFIFGKILSVIPSLFALWPSGFESELTRRIFTDLLFVTFVHYDLYQLTQHIDAFNLASQSLRCGNGISQSGQLFVQIFIGIFCWSKRILNLFILI